VGDAFVSNVELRTILLGLVASVLVCASAHAADRPDLSAYGRTPQIESPRFSPSGQLFAAVMGDESGRAVTLFDAQTLKVTNVLPLGASKFRHLLWIDDDRLVIVQSVTARQTDINSTGTTARSENYFALEYNLKTQKQTPLLKGVDRTLNTIAGAYPVRAVSSDGPNRLILYSLTSLNRYYVLSLIEHRDSGEDRVVAEGASDTVDWAVGPTGKVVGEVRYFAKTGAWQVRVGPDLERLNVVQKGISLIQRPSFAGVSADQKTVFVRVTDGQETAVHPVNTETGAWGDELPSRDRSFITDDGTQVVFGTVKADGDHLQYQFTDPSDQAFWHATKKAFNGAEVGLQSIASDRSRMIVEVFGGGFGNSYYLVNRKTGGAKLIGDLRKDVGPDQINERSYIHYDAADGMDIPAYLTLPRNRAAKDLPLIVLPHAGPFARDDIGFDWWSQAYASLGYAVLQPQFRGSDGFGLEHLKAGFGEYGRKMQTDLSDGVTDLVEKGVADPKRVAIVGGSYGGYAALAGVTLQTGIYRCAVSLAGPSNMSQQLLYTASMYGPRSSASRYWYEYLGVKTDRAPALDTISPEFHAAKASAPILLIHGVDDTVVPIEQSKRMETALKRAGKPVEMVTLKGEDHWLSTSETRLEMLTASTAFLEQCNPLDH
jgi:dipeptidyl aminopeptidase/acylaminoacyl peptidase